jgi:hypothetical protein
MTLLVLGLVASALAGGTHATPVQIRASASPASVGVGDPVTYVVETHFDADDVEGSSVKIFADTGPFAQIGPASTTRTRKGRTVGVRLEQRIACLDLACAPTAESRRGIELPPASVSARLVSGGVVAAKAARVAITVEPRLSNADVRATPPPFEQQTALPPPSGRVRRLPGLLAATATVLGIVALLFAVLALRPRAVTRPREAALARAVRLLRESSLRSAPDRRRAADLVSRVAGSAGERPLADEAARLAWSAGPPEPDAAVALADRAEATPQ